MTSVGMTGGPRCRWAIHFGTTLRTRCLLDADHGSQHEGMGLIAFPYQRIAWLAGDRREYETDRDDTHAWEEGPATPTTPEERATARDAVREFLRMLDIPVDDWPRELRDG